MSSARTCITVVPVNGSAPGRNHGLTAGRSLPRPIQAGYEAGSRSQPPPARSAADLPTIPRTARRAPGGPPGSGAPAPPASRRDPGGMELGDAARRQQQLDVEAAEERHQIVRSAAPGVGPAPNASAIGRRWSRTPPSARPAPVRDRARRTCSASARRRHVLSLQRGHPPGRRGRRRAQLQLAQGVRVELGQRSELVLGRPRRRRPIGVNGSPVCSRTCSRVAPGMDRYEHAPRRVNPNTASR